jgi:glucosyl-3-phosphoglycerate synthase
VADFHQGGAIATLHRLETANLEELEREVTRHARQRPIALVLPCLFAEFTRPAIRQIIEELAVVPYLEEIVVSLGQTTADDLPVARRAFERLPQRVSFIWNDGPAMRSLYTRLGEHGFDVSQDGKGRSCWISYGYVLASRRSEVIASHDCDITTYSRELLARLCYPVVDPAFGFEFAKGYYARVTGTMNGRVTRLFVTPLLRSLETVLGRVPVLCYLDSFRYALAGEFAMRRDVARRVSMPGNWGLEVGVLAEVFRHCGASRVCQTELCATYDHKHQVLDAADPAKGLLKMSIDIASTILRSLAADGIVFTADIFRTLALQYVRTAEDTILQYQADAAINGLSFDLHRESETVGAFSGGLAIACRRHLDDPCAGGVYPGWDRVVAAIPEFPRLLASAVDEDSRATAAA